MLKSFAQLARSVDQSHSSVSVSKEPLGTPPLDIRTLGDCSLRKRTERITKVDESVREIARQMLHSMYTARGIGLAAPQVGIHKQLMVIDLEIEDPVSPPLVLINPEITSAGASITTYEEGCLSIPGVYLDVVRPTTIEVNFRDEMGRPRRMKVDGLMARCIQHELDHLHGVLFVDRVQDKSALDQELKSHGFKADDIRSLT